MALDYRDLVPKIYCEASDLLEVPPLSLDPISEQVQSNTLAIHSLVSKIESLEVKLSSLIESDSYFTTGTSHSSSNTTYVAAASQPLTVVSVPFPPHSDKMSSMKMTHHSEARDSQLILLGLPEQEPILYAKSDVNELLEFLARKPVLIKDMFRLGKNPRSHDLASARPRPVLIKLSTAWNRKLVLLHWRSL